MPSSRLHIVHIIPTLLFGGAERTVVDIINYSDPEKFRFSVILFFEHPEMMAQIKRSDVDVVVVPKRGRLSLGLFGQLTSELSKIKPDIVHTHLFGADFWGRVAAHRLKIPVVTTEHNININEGFIKVGIKRLLKNYSREYTATSGAIAYDMGRRYGIHPEKIEVIRPGVPIGEFAHIKPVETLAPPFRLLMLGRLTRQKGFDIALRALRDLVKFPWKLTIVGEGELDHQLRLLVAKLGLNERVTFLPPVSDVKSLLAQHDIILVPSRWEGLGIVAVEALAAGRIVIASHVGGLPEVVRDGETGLTFAHTSFKALAEQLQFCFEHPTEVVPLARAGQLYAQKYFDVKEMAEKYQVLYQRTLSS